jgi:hypothetical protein
MTCLELIVLLQFFSFFYTFGMAPLMGDQPFPKPLSTQDNTIPHYTQTPITPVGFKPTIRASERMRIFGVSHGAVAVM